MDQFKSHARTRVGVVSVCSGVKNSFLDQTILICFLKKCNLSSKNVEIEMLNFLNFLFAGCALKRELA